MGFQCECHEARIKWHVILMSQASYNIDLFIVTIIFWGLWVNRFFFHNYSNPLEAYCCCSMIVANVYFFFYNKSHMVSLPDFTHSKWKSKPTLSPVSLMAFRIKRNPINLSWSSSTDIGLCDHCVTLQINHQANITRSILFRK